MIFVAIILSPCLWTGTGKVTAVAELTQAIKSGSGIVKSVLNVAIVSWIATIFGREMQLSSIFKHSQGEFNIKRIVIMMNNKL